MVHGQGPRAGQPLIEHPHVPLISFTGGTVTGKAIARTAAPMLKKLSLELGGKNATIVFADADLDECVAGTVRAAFANQGEICLCGSRILVERKIYDVYLAKFVAATKALVVGDPSDPKTFCGAVCSKEHQAKILSYIKLAEEEGGKIECGGADARPPNLPERCANGYWVMPTVVTGLKHDCRCNMEEVFGPFVSIAPFDTEQEAVAVANSTQYGLSASVWSTNIKTCQRVSMALDVGYVWINTWLVRDLRAPFGGSRSSGVGREGGEYAVDFYSEVKSICSKY
jgi:aminomuconate-semialdehyde/2-hydroxymuconate-6-semialdehyde dehydrogenase